MFVQPIFLQMSFLLKKLSCFELVWLSELTNYCLQEKDYQYP